jgi:4'-phosphopantetheinyl transferase EntD
MQLSALEHESSAILNLPLRLVRADHAVALTALSTAERIFLDRFEFEQRRRDWLCGRNALKKILAKLGRRDDTGALRFPHRQLSLSHDDGISYAAGTRAESRGLGIDYEPLRTVNAGVARWFLGDGEVDWLSSQPSCARARHIIRLWTIKEAAFKSHPRNHAMSLGDFEILEPAEQSVHAVTTAAGADIRVVCRKFSRGYLSIAVFGKPYYRGE